MSRSGDRRGPARACVADGSRDNGIVADRHAACDDTGARPGTVRTKPPVMRHLLHRHLLLILPVLASACAELSLSEATKDADPDDVETPDAPTDADTGIPSVVATYWGVGGTLVIAGGAVDTAASMLQLETRGTECVLKATLDAANVPASRPTGAENVVSWWTCTVTPDPEATCTWPATTSFGVGLGVSDAELQPAADRVGLDATSAYGLYLGQGSDVYLVGIAGTSDVLEGAEAPVVEPPVPDGTYELVTLHGIPVP